MHASSLFFVGVGYGNLVTEKASKVMGVARRDFSPPKAESADTSLCHWLLPFLSLLSPPLSGKLLSAGRFT